MVRRLGRIRRGLHQGTRNPLLLLVLAAGLVAFAVQSGELGSSDTQHRLQSTHSFWTAEPPVFPQEYPEFGVHGRGGKLESWYGIGQSLLMLPSDIAGTYAERIPLFKDYNGNDPSVRNIIVSYSTNILLAVLTAIVCFRFLRQLSFSPGQAAAGVLALLCATTHLHYTQNMMENNYIFLLTLTGFSYQYEWACHKWACRTRTFNGEVRSRETPESGRTALRVGSIALGLNLLTRLTTGLDLVAAGIFILLALWLGGIRGRSLGQRLLVYLKTSIPVYAVFLVIDRLYQYHRFGSFFNTYLGVMARETRARNPALPSNYPFENPFHAGFLGALFSPEKSIFLFDPLLVLMILLAAVGWKRFSSSVKAYVISTGLLLAAYISFYARYTVWSGDSAWGDRYVSTTVELSVLLAIPLLLALRRQMGRLIRLAGYGLIAVSLAIQTASVCFWCPLEIYQMNTLGHPTFVVALRLKNVAAFALGKMSSWDLMNSSMLEDPWDYVHITTWNFLPFLLKRSGEVPQWVVDITLAAWLLALALLAAVLWRLNWALSQARGLRMRRGAMNQSGVFPNRAESLPPADFSASLQASSRDRDP